MHFCEHGANGGGEIAVIVVLDEMRNDFSIRIAGEGVPLGRQSRAQLCVILDDAVVDHGDAAAAIEMRMRVAVARTSVRSPARVPDARGALERALLERFFEIAELADALCADDGACVDERNAGRIVAAILKTVQAVHEHADDVTRSDVTDDAAHGKSSSPPYERRQTLRRSAVKIARSWATATSNSSLMIR